MTEPDSFEEDIFADLYDDSEPSKAGPGSQQVAASTADAHGVEHDAAAVTANDTSQHDQDERIKQEADDKEDDEADFNLGGGGGGSSAAPAVQNDSPSTPPYGTVHRESAKEDGMSVARTCVLLPRDIHGSSTACCGLGLVVLSAAGCRDDRQACLGGEAARLRSGRLGLVESTRSTEMSANSNEERCSS